jgi:hypothetical protein
VSKSASTWCGGACATAAASASACRAKWWRGCALKEGIMNGRAELVKYLAGLALAGLVSYLTALGTLQQDVAILKERYDWLTQDVAEIKADLKLLLRGTD